MRYEGFLSSAGVWDDLDPPRQEHPHIEKQPVLLVAVVVVLVMTVLFFVRAIGGGGDEILSASVEFSIDATTRQQPIWARVHLWVAAADAVAVAVDVVLLCVV